jgi:hypothetical protein
VRGVGVGGEGKQLHQNDFFFFTASLGVSREVNAAAISTATVVVNAPSPARFLYGELAPSPSFVASAVFEKGSGPGSGAMQAMQAQVLPCKMFLSTTALEVSSSGGRGQQIFGGAGYKMHATFYSRTRQSEDSFCNS